MEAIVTTYIQSAGLPTTATNPVILLIPTTLTSGPDTWPATTVDVTYTHDYVFVGNVLSLVGGSLGTVNLQARTTMRDETAGGP